MAEESALAQQVGEGRAISPASDGKQGGIQEAVEIIFV